MIAVRKLVTICLAALGLCTAFGAAQAQAAFSITEFDGALTNLDGSPSTQASARANLHIGARFPTTTNAQGNIAPDGMLKRLAVTLPPGLVADPSAVGICPESELMSHPVFGGLAGGCPNDSIIGLATITTIAGSEIALPVGNLRPAPGTAAQFGFNLFGAITKIGTVTREGGRKLVTTVEAPEAIAITGAALTLWGVPADPAHDSERGGAFGICGDGTPAPCEALLPRAGLITSPTDCSAGPLSVGASAVSWQSPALFAQSAFTLHLPDGTPVGMSGCEAVEFAPTMTVRPTSSEAAAPTGLDVELTVPQNQNPDGLATAHVKKVTTRLPAGMAVNVSQSNGAGACSPSQFDLFGDQPERCPDPSKIGSMEVVTPLLEQPLKGGVYLAQQGNNPFNSVLALYAVAADHERGVNIKLAAKVSPDPQTGQLTVTFDDSPQLPFETLRMHLDGGDRAPLVNPSTCGTHATHVELTSWSQQGVPVPADSSFAIDRGCGKNAAFTPGFEAGSANPLAGGASPFTLRVTRPDGQPNITSIETHLPEGLLAKLAGVGICPDASAATGACPAASQIGTATVGAGAGVNPIYVPQAGRPPTAVYLAGPYKGAPYSLVVKVPSQAGPFDLGTVAVRNAVQIDPVTARISVKSDPLPQFLEGIPVSYRDIRVDVDRTDFTRNPTSCAPMAVEGAIGSALGGAAKVSDRFQVANCGSLGFKPALKLRLAGGTKRGDYPKLRAVLRAKPGQANIDRVSVALPHSAFLAQEHIRTICTRVQFAADACPAGSIYGHARAFTPLLDRPLEGPVYLRSSSNELPDMVAALDGQIKIDLAGRIDSVNGGIRNTFDLVPDAPVTKFVLEMKGGKKGLLVNSRNLCASVSRAKVKMDGQNGKFHDFSPVLKPSCGGGKKKSGQR